MTRPRLGVFAALGFVLAGAGAHAQTAPNSPDPGSTNGTPVPTEAADDREWAFSLTASSYLIPGDRDYVQPTFTADRGWLHLEARYNYEALDTGSAWVGYNFSGGETLRWEVTPMLGVVFGATTGVAPGYKATFAWWKLQLYSEGEYVFDTRSSSDSFLYNWSELSLAPVDWFRFGLVAQRTRAYKSDRDIQRGLLLGFAFEWLDFTCYVFNPDQDKPSYVLAIGLNF